eukprot:Hpha_TRINITY_DN5492_c0_g1::TRINITY_DN5492_c0_g1_i1::g.192518::m.192518
MMLSFPPPGMALKRKASDGALAGGVRKRPAIGQQTTPEPWPSAPPPDAGVEEWSESRELLQCEVSGHRAPPSAGSAPASFQYVMGFLESFEYSMEGPSFPNRKARPLSEILKVAAQVVAGRTRVSIQCIEAAFVGLYLTQGMPRVTRFGVSLESALPSGQRYFHQVLGVAVPQPEGGVLFGALGLSRDFGLASKPAVFPSIAHLLRNYRVHYRRAGHQPVSCKLGRAIHNGRWRHDGTNPSQFEEPPVWIQEDFLFSDPEWVHKVGVHQERLLSGGSFEWPPVSAEPYRRKGGPAPDPSVFRAQLRPRRVAYSPPRKPLGERKEEENRHEVCTPHRLNLRKRTNDVSAVDEFTRKVRLGHFRRNCPGRVSLVEVCQHVHVLEAFAKTRLSARLATQRREQL